jgi:hypothetical protein
MPGGCRFHAISVAAGAFADHSYLFAAARFSFRQSSQTRILLRFLAALSMRHMKKWDVSAGKMVKGVEKWADVG